MVPTTLTSALNSSNNTLFPNIHTVLRIMLLFSVATCTCERSISVLNRVKSYNCKTQTDERITGLCLNCAYREIAVDWDKVVNTFAAQNPRKITLINVLNDDNEDNE